MTTQQIEQLEELLMKYALAIEGSMGEPEFNKIQNFITTLLEKQREEYVEMIEKTKLPQNSSSNGMTTLMYIPNEPFNIEVNKRIDWIIDKIKSHDKTS